MRQEYVGVDFLCAFGVFCKIVINFTCACNRSYPGFAKDCVTKVTVNVWNI